MLQRNAGADCVDFLSAMQELAVTNEVYVSPQDPVSQAHELEFNGLCVPLASPPAEPQAAYSDLYWLRGL